MKLLKVIEGAHRDERGAIAMLALAGILITFMTALILYDAGFAVRHKFKSQIAADAGAYSQAVVKARVMNTVAYINVTKRTFTGIWGMYVGMMYQFYREAKGDVSCAIDSYLRANEDNPEEAGRRVYYLLLHGLFSNPMKVWLNANRAQIEQDCPGAVDQYMVFWEEAAGDYLGFSGLDIRVDGYGGFTAPYATDSAEYYRKNVRRLNWMQQQLLRTAPKWSKVEGMVRARSSGAHKIDAFMTEMPSTQGSLSNVCLRGTGHLSGAIRSGGELAREITANKNQHARRSDAESKFTSAYPGNLAAGLNHMGGTGCNSLQANFGAGFGGMLRPFIPTRTEAQDYVHTGRETPLESYRDDHFEFIGEDLGHPEVKEYEGASCGEIVDLAPDFRGFRASWAPRIAPVGKCRPANAGWWK